MAEAADNYFDRKSAQREARHRRRLGYAYGVFGSLCAVVAVIFGIAMGGSLSQEWQLAARWTARVSMALFAILFLVDAFERWSRKPASNRHFRTALRAFAGSHAVHLVALTTYLLAAGGSASPVTLLGGGIGYLAIGMLLAATSLSMAELIGDDLRQQIITGCLWYLWLIFLLSYAGRLASGTGTLFSAFALGLCAIIAAVWLARLLRARREAA